MAKRLDLLNQKFGKWTVIAVAENGYDNRSNWLCKCDCGTERKILGQALKAGQTKSCGCIQREDLTGKKFGRLIVINIAHSKKWARYWSCLCECGNTKLVSTVNLKKGLVKSCGCLSIEKAKARCGSKHPNWNPQLSKAEREYARKYDERYIFWSKQIKINARYRCCKCGSSIDLQSHHIQSWKLFPEKRYDLTNGICLCGCCHKKFHKQYGRIEAGLEALQEFLS